MTTMGRTEQTASAPVLYTEEERRKRDESGWTLVQGILAPIQFVVFLASLTFILRYMITGNGLLAAEVSIVAKTFTLYAIMITGSIWEKQVFGCYLFARPFFWEDVFSMLVLALHTAYLLALFLGLFGDHGRLLLALAAYATYVVNAGQFVWKLRLARLDAASRRSAPAVGLASGLEIPGGAS
ncbi:2-vinyl bacteriochlorophyllide hydratase [Rhizobium sp. TRM95796]|uniref:2-vinyl bacteriochlorophyllide hydratase n=1 Tax=Rhizobium sp. TRM95796 TaxID=2979862 RepID=UPI0021E6EB54|nr:2-vinyl bacteriochlorophyllide hydratase [Rhizobium sp. TRM95796]MCV3768056.1 2-vinyl bacteriochlorophyllide hydratase [Rhizobium sp. TRM95796]